MKPEEFLGSIQEDGHSPSDRTPKGARPPRSTHKGLPGRNRREKRLNVKLAQKAYLADRRAKAAK